MHHTKAGHHVLSIFGISNIQSWKEMRHLAITAPFWNISLLPTRTHCYLSQFQQFITFVLKSSTDKFPICVFLVLGFHTLGLCATCPLSQETFPRWWHHIFFKHWGPVLLQHMKYFNIYDPSASKTCAVKADFSKQSNFSNVTEHILHTKYHISSSVLS